MSDKLVIKADLIRKEAAFKTRPCVIEKAIELSEDSFRELLNNPLSDNFYIKDNCGLMYDDGEAFHCLLFVGAESGDGLIVESEGYDYARYSQFVPHAKNMLLAQELTESEKKLHRYLHNNTNGWINSEKESFLMEHFYLTEASDLQDIISDSCYEIASKNPAAEEVEIDNYGVFVYKKELVTTKLYCPLRVEVDKGDGYPEETSSQVIRGYMNEINRAIDKSMQYKGATKKWLERGLIAGTDNKRLDALVYSAFPSVERKDGNLYGVITVKSFGQLSGIDFHNLTEEIAGQLSDGWGESFEQQEIGLGNYDYYISFWHIGEDYYLKTEPDESLQQDMTMKM